MFFLTRRRAQAVAVFLTLGFLNARPTLYRFTALGCDLPIYRVGLRFMSFNLFNSDGSIDQGKFATAMRNLERSSVTSA